MYDIKGLYIDGQWVQATGGDGIEILNPATEEVLGRCPSASRNDTLKAIRAAEKGLSSWRCYDPWQRSEIIRRIGELLQDRIERYSILMSLESGKPLAQARREWRLSIDQFFWFAEETKRIYGRTVTSRVPHGLIRIEHEPVGIVAAFTAWNFPAALLARKLAPALAAGCSVICRPSKETPATAMAIVECCHDAGVPAGVVNLVTGVPSATSAVLMDSPQVRKVSLTGSTDLGKQMVRESAATLKKITMELGGHAPAIIFDDANLEAAVAASVTTKFANCGQVCVTPNRFFVQRRVFESFVAQFIARTASLVLGNGLEDGVHMGPLRTEKRRNEVDVLVKDALARGAQLATGGGRPASFERGFFYSPTVLLNVPDEARLMKEESFGPVALINVFDDEDEVITRANDSVYGLSAYVWTQSLHRASHISGRLESGMVGVNSYALAAAETPFGGIKESGFGREGGSECLKDYLNVKYTHVVTLP